MGNWSRLSAAHAAAFAAFLGLWTWKLLEPRPVPEAVAALLSLGDWHFWAAKSLHLGGYAFLTALAATLPVAPRRRWALVGLLALHGAATEAGQTLVPNRHGSVRDVAVDWAGVALGVLAGRVARRRPGP